MSVFEVPGWICPFCETDCSPIGHEPCDHYFATDGENGWRFSGEAKNISEAADAKSGVLFRDLLYHDPACREHLKLRRANYDDSLEMYVFTENMTATETAFRAAINNA